MKTRLHLPVNQVRNYSNDNCTVHWIYRKALFKSDLRNHKGRNADLSK